MSATFVLDGPPVSKKNSWAIGNSSKWGTRMYNRNKGLKGYLESIQIQAVFQARRQKFVKICKGTRVALRVRVFFKASQASMDVHNAVETVLDALQGVCYDNDNQVVGLYTPPQRLVDDSRPRIEVEVQDEFEAARDPRWQK